MLSRLFMLAIIVGLLITIQHYRRQKKPTSSNHQQKKAGSPSLSQQEALAILGLQAPTSKAEIQRAYKHLINKVHPDKGGTDFFAAQLNHAKQVLLQDQHNNV